MTLTLLRRDAQTQRPTLAIPLPESITAERLAGVISGLSNLARPYNQGLRRYGVMLPETAIALHPSGDVLEPTCLEPARRRCTLRHANLKSGDQSDRSACMTSTRAARAAGTTDATTAAANSTTAEVASRSSS